MATGTVRILLFADSHLGFDLPSRPRSTRRRRGHDFLANHEAFLASGCMKRPEVCPRSAEELDLANMMVVAAMNAGTASTFPPFRCNR